MKFNPLAISDVCSTLQYLFDSAQTIITTAEGTLYTARILVRADLNRQIVRSPSCEILLPEYELTLPSCARGQLTTVEGLIRDVVADLSGDKPLRRIQDEETYKKIQGLIDELKKILGDEENDADEVQVGKAAERVHIPMPAFTIKLDDPAGHSFIEFVGSMADPKWNMRTYPRSFQQNVDLGLVAQDEGQASNGMLSNVVEADPGLGGGEAGTDEEIYVFPGVCPSCAHPLDTLMKKVVIPYFKVSCFIPGPYYYGHDFRLIYIGYSHHVNKL